MAAASALVRAPRNVMQPPMTHTKTKSKGDPNWVAINAGFMKMAEPMIPPATSDIVDDRLRVRSSFSAMSLEKLCHISKTILTCVKFQGYKEQAEKCN